MTRYLDCFSWFELDTFIFKLQVCEQLYTIVFYKIQKGNALVKTLHDHYDVLVAGGGQAGLIAAIVAAEKGARVCLLEGAPRPYRGGNTRH
ncbi:FAD-dependent oxidoreductase, partial [Thalassospira sp. MCCC 1A01428]|uniref:FAD-dependent oxidoreductase n=1 Tax=Thalassospira sp. MCCC 1A01428 TaxID=1470575 RepID=UPI001AEF5C2A